MSSTNPPPHPAIDALYSDWTVGFGAQAQSDYYTENGAVKITQGGYWLANARAGYDINEHFSASLNANNLLDRRYYSSLHDTGSWNFYGDPRNFTLTLKYRL